MDEQEDNSDLANRMMGRCRLTMVIVVDYYYGGRERSSSDAGDSGYSSDISRWSCISVGVTDLVKG